jgi:hypothetical protein
VFSAPVSFVGYTWVLCRLPVVYFRQSVVRKSFKVAESTRTIGRAGGTEIAVETAIFRKVVTEMKSKTETALELQMVVPFRYWA